MTTRRACCSCGALAITCEGDPVRISVCHCLSCQHRTGSAFGVQARFPQERVTTSGEARTWTRIADSGKPVTYHFCPVCGNIVWYTLGVAPGLIAVPVGGFADPTFPAPTVSIYEARKHPWVAVAVPEHLD